MERFKPVHILQTPPGKTAQASLDFRMSQIGDLIDRLEKITGRKITRGGMEKAVSLANRRQQAFRRFLELHKLSSCAISGEEALIVTGASFHDDIARWAENVERLCLEREERFRAQPDDSAPQLRLLLAGAPLIHPNFKLLRLIEAGGRDGSRR
ncbi:MAG: 2-hydroxyacyl-CoA dehydratase [Armatimonadetes bacterium]|nr:2-hydroxyacyl-CoA dehydratase [Armatimonadota bacterium]